MIEHFFSLEIMGISFLDRLVVVGGGFTVEIGDPPGVFLVVLACPGEVGHDRGELR